MSQPLSDLKGAHRGALFDSLQQSWGMRPRAIGRRYRGMTVAPGVDRPADIRQHAGIASGESFSGSPPPSSRSAASSTSFEQTKTAVPVAARSRGF